MIGIPSLIGISIMLGGRLQRYPSHNNAIKEGGKLW